MSNAIFPSAVRGLAFTVVKSFDFTETIVQTSPNRDENRIAQVQNPIWHWQLIYEFLIDNPAKLTTGLTYTDLKTMMGFLMARRGKFDDFLYLDPDDNSVGPALITGTPNPQAQLQLVNDGSGNYYSPLQRNMGGQFYEDITDLQPAGGADLTTLSVYANSVLKHDPADYTIVGPGLSIPGYSFSGLVIAWGASPTPPINAQFSFYFRARIESDTQDFEKWANMWWAIGGDQASSGSGVIKLMSARTGQ